MRLLIPVPPVSFVLTTSQMRDACIPAANGHFTAKALASLYDNLLGSLGLSGGDSSNERRGSGQSREPLLRRARVNEMRAYQVWCGMGWWCGVGGVWRSGMGWERLAGMAWFRRFCKLLLPSGNHARFRSALLLWS